MIKQSWNISSEEKLRILSLHENATKNNYLLGEQGPWGYKDKEMGRETRKAEGNPVEMNSGSPIVAKSLNQFNDEFPLYKIGASLFIFVDDKLYRAKWDNEKNMFIPVEELTTEPSFVVDLSTQGLPMQFLAKDQKMSNSYEVGKLLAKQNLIDKMDPKADDVGDSIPIVTIGEKGGIQLPVFAWFTLRGTNNKIPNLERSDVIVYQKTYDKVKGKFYYAYSEPSFRAYGIPVKNAIPRKLYFCLTTDKGTKFTTFSWFFENEDTDPKLQIGLVYEEGKVIDATGPYQSEKEAMENCKSEIIKLPEVIPFEEKFKNNKSIPIGLDENTEAIIKLKEFFNKGGKLKSFTIEASASRVPAGSVENNPNLGKWKDNKDYDGKAEGTNDDKTGNLQLTKARAYNLYLKLLELVPELKNVPHKIIGNGSQGDPWDGVDADAEKYRRERKVNLIPLM